MTQSNSNPANSNPATVVATRKLNQESQEVFETPYGDKYRLRPIPTLLMAEVMAEIKDPIPPTYVNPQTGREEENFASPEYAEQRAAAKKARDEAAMDAMIYFGIELITAVPQDDWAKEYQWYLKRHGKTLNLSNIEDPIEREFLYKKYRVATSPDIMTKLAEINGFGSVTEEQLTAARATFPDTSEGDADTGDGAGE